MWRWREGEDGAVGALRASCPLTDSGKSPDICVHMTHDQISPDGK